METETTPMHILIAYGMVTAVWFVCAAAWSNFTNVPRERKVSAQAAWLAPFWFSIVLVLVIRWMINLWIEAWGDDK